VVAPPGVGDGVGVGSAGRCEGHGSGVAVDPAGRKVSPRGQLSRVGSGVGDGVGEGDGVGDGVSVGRSSVTTKVTSNQYRTTARPGWDP
jgi:hypothetical protein